MGSNTLHHYRDPTWFLPLGFQLLPWDLVNINALTKNVESRKCGSSVVSALASGARGPRFDPRSWRGKFWCPNTLSLVSFAGMALNKCAILRIGTLPGCPLYKKSHPFCRLKNPTIIYIWLLVGCHPATPSVQSTPADNAHESVRQYIEKERKKDY